eukprot:1997472-Rhodomonas_salina.2
MHLARARVLSDVQRVRVRVDLRGVCLDVVERVVEEVCLRLEVARDRVRGPDDSTTQLCR